MNFDFLKTVEVNQEVKKATKTSIEKLPEGLTLRVFANGKVFPSKELTDKYLLEYTAKEAENAGFGFDIFKSSDWTGFPADAPEVYLFAAAINRDLPKVSLFNSCGYNEDGSPKASVLTQGGGSFGKELVELVESVFGIKLEKGDYADLTINEEISIPSNTGVYYIPKTVSSGDRKGQPDAVRRENIIVNPLMLADTSSITESGSTEGSTENATAEAEVTVDAVQATIPGFESEASFDESAAKPEMPAMPDFNIPTV